MAESIKNLCAPIPADLHAKVRQKQEDSGLTLGQYMAQLLTKFYEQEERPMAKENQRTVAFQVDAELFERFKEYLKANGIKQNAFFLNAIRRALEEDTAADVSH